MPPYELRRIHLLDAISYEGCDNCRHKSYIDLQQAIKMCYISDPMMEVIRDIVLQAHRDISSTTIICANAPTKPSPAQCDPEPTFCAYHVRYNFETEYQACLQLSAELLGMAFNSIYPDQNLSFDQRYKLLAMVEELTPRWEVLREVLKMGREMQRLNLTLSSQSRMATSYKGAVTRLGRELASALEELALSRAENQRLEAELSVEGALSAGSEAHAFARAEVRRHNAELRAQETEDLRDDISILMDGHLL